MAPDLRASFPAFVQGMSKGKEKLDDVLRDVYQVTPGGVPDPDGRLGCRTVRTGPMTDRQARRTGTA